MSSSIASTLMLIFIPSILLLVSSPAATSSSALIEQACTVNRNGFSFSHKLCIRLLQSQPKVASAKNMFDLSIAIIEAGISRSTHVRTHVESLLRSTDPNLKSVAQDCKLAYDWNIGSLKSALSEVQIKDYISANYDLLIASMDDIKRCNNAITSKQVVDKVIVRGNKIVQTLGLAALGAVEKL